MKFEPIKKQKRIYETIIQRIKEAITDGKLSPGDKLPSERAMAEMFDVSRTSVKEAVTVLEASGIITVRPGVGMFIREDPLDDLLDKFYRILDESSADFFDLLELRQAIEGDAAYLAAKRMTSEEGEKLTELYNELLTMEKQGEAALKEDIAFHYFIVQTSKNQLMVEVFNLISDKIQSYLKESREFSKKDIWLNQDVMTEHANIFQTIIDKKPHAAREAMWEHHQKIKERYIQQRMGDEK